jgi:hypothetical protein
VREGRGCTEQARVTAARFMNIDDRNLFDMKNRWLDSSPTTLALRSKYVVFLSEILKEQKLFATVFLA